MMLIRGVIYEDVGVQGQPDLAILTQHEAGVPVKELVRKHGVDSRRENVVLR